MGLFLVFLIFVAVVIAFFVISARVGTKIDPRGEAQHDQELQGVGADQHEEPSGERDGGVMG